jgi:hypothetical protein
MPLESTPSKGRNVTSRAAALLAELRSLISASEAEEDRYREALERVRDLIEAALEEAVTSPAAARIAEGGLQSIELEADEDGAGDGEDEDGDGDEWNEGRFEEGDADSAAGADEDLEAAPVESEGATAAAGAPEPPPLLGEGPNGKLEPGEKEGRAPREFGVEE